MMKENGLMRPLYKEVRNKNLDASGKLNRSLSDMVNSGFVRVEGCVLLAGLKALAGGVSAEDFPDRTGYECFINLIHVEDYLNEEEAAQHLILLGQGLAAAYTLAERLSIAFKDESFKVIVSADELSCSVRFHSVREGEVWLAEDLETYREEAIFVLEI